MRQLLVEKYLCKKKNKVEETESVNESSELWFGAWSRSNLIWVRGNKVLYHNNIEFPTGSTMGEAERVAARGRGFVLLDW